MTTPSDIYPGLFYDDAPAAIEWLCRAFGFTKRLVVSGEPGVIQHAELSLGTGVIMVSSSNPERGLASPRRQAGEVSQALSVFVGDPDAHFARSVAAGAQVVRDLRDEEYGARGYMVKDPEGHQWYFGNYRPGAHWAAEAAGSAGTD